MRRLRAGRLPLAPVVTILENLRNLPPLTFGILAELPDLQLTTLVRGRYSDVRPYRHGWYGSGGQRYAN